MSILRAMFIHQCIQIRCSMTSGNDDEGWATHIQKCLEPNRTPANVDSFLLCGGQVSLIHAPNSLVDASSLCRHHHHVTAMTKRLGKRRRLWLGNEVSDVQISQVRSNGCLVSTGLYCWLSCFLSCAPPWQLIQPFLFHGPCVVIYEPGQFSSLLPHS